MSIKTLESEGLRPSTRTSVIDGANVSYVLWHKVTDDGKEVCDDKGRPTYSALTKPATHGETTTAYYNRIREGTDPAMMRICPTGQRPDSLGYRK